MAIAGVALFQRTMSGWDFRPVFWITTVIKCTASFIDIIIVNRWNRDIGDESTAFCWHFTALSMPYIGDLSSVTPHCLSLTFHRLKLAFHLSFTRPSVVFQACRTN